jgi:hypothetical protein
MTTTLAFHVTGGQAAQLLVDQRQQRIEGIGFATVPGEQQRRRARLRFGNGAMVSRILKGDAPFRRRFTPLSVEGKKPIMRTQRGCNRFWILALCPVALIAAASSAAAQTATSGQWEIELHGGGMSPSSPTGGTVSLPGPGQVFTTMGIYSPSPALVVSSSRRESSWYFGDGALLFNQTAAAIAASTVAMTQPFAGRITALDPVISSSLGERQRGGSVGARISRVLTPRFSAEVSVDYSLARLQISQATSDAIEATRASFIAAFNGLITSNPSRVLKNLTSTATLQGGGGRQLFTSAAVIVNLRTAGNVIPYATAGASLISTTGTAPSVTLSGNYQFNNPTGSPINESDTVTVRDDRDVRTVAGILGGGVKYHVSPRWGIRLDARVSLGRNTSSTVIDATPNVVLGQLPAGRGLLNSSPTIQFSNNSTDPVTALGVTAVAASTLTGPALAGVRTFSGSGVSSHTDFTAGIFWRF